MKAPSQPMPQITGISSSNVAEKIEVMEIERPLTCEEAAELLRVHPKTIKRMAGRGELPGHFRFGRWFFYPSELDSWMRIELDSSRHPCR
jgi:excisionase family DNA binding protein